MSNTFESPARETYRPHPTGLTGQQAYQLVTAEANQYAENTALQEELGLGNNTLTEGRLNGPHTWLYLDETDNNTQNFKLNGAGNAVDKVSGVLTPGSDLLVPSAGNWAQAVTYTAGFFGFNTVVYCPREEFDRVDQAIVQARRDAKLRDDAELMHPFDNVYGVAGQALVGKRVVAGLVQRADEGLWQPFEDQVVIQVPRGGGSLLAATAFEVEQARASGCFGSNVQVRSARPNKAAETELFDGLNVQQMGTLGRLASGNQRFVQGESSFSEADTGRALGLVYQAIGKKVEPSGAAATAAMLADADENRTPTTYVTIVSGANVTDERYAHFRDAPRREQQELLKVGGPLGQANGRHTKELLGTVNDRLYRSRKKPTMHYASGPTWRYRDPSGDLRR